MCYAHPFNSLAHKTAKKLSIRGGVQVQSVNSNGILAKARVRAGYIITHINDKAIRSIGDMAALTGKVESIDGVYPDGRAASYTIINE